MKLIEWLLKLLGFIKPIEDKENKEVTVSELRKAYPSVTKHGTKWTKEELHKLEQLWLEGDTIADISSKLDRTTNSIATKLITLGYSSSRYRRDSGFLLKKKKIKN
jgi:hypothetical protein